MYISGQMEQLIHFINRYTTLDKAAEKALGEMAKPENLQKNEFLLKPRQYCNKLWFIKSGLIRRYHVRKNKELTIWIYYENQWVTSSQSFFYHEPASEYLQACENSELISISEEASQALIQYPAIQKFSTRHLQEMLACTEKFALEFNPLSASEKYQYLFDHAAPIMKRAKLGHIASLMGISQETLSRIRARN